MQGSPENRSISEGPQPRGHPTDRDNKRSQIKYTKAELYTCNQKWARRLAVDLQQPLPNLAVVLQQPLGAQIQHIIFSVSLCLTLCQCQHLEIPIMYPHWDLDLPVRERPAHEEKDHPTEDVHAVRGKH